MSISQYIHNLNRQFKTGQAREHSYRGDLQTLLSAICPDVVVTNEPARIKCGAPDYQLSRKDIAVGYIEAKDLGADLSNKSYKEQFTRYKKSLSNLIITNYIDFWFYKDGELTTKISIGLFDGVEVAENNSEYNQFTNLVVDFSNVVSQTIKSSKRLASLMAGKARLMQDVFQKSLVADIEDKLNPDTALQQQYNAFKEVLLKEIQPAEFADLYAQTIAYGMFAARLHDPTLDDFNRQEAAELIPKSNPFLRKLFQFIAGYDLDDRLKWIVEDLADIFRATNVADLLKDFGKSTQRNDPMIHFYEDFLGEYDSKLRAKRGVWYTPEPVVNFIVRAVDDILKSEFGLKDGLADTSTIRHKTKVHTTIGKNKSGLKDYEFETHRVQILDPATGTGTFLAEVVKHIYGKYKSMQGIWSSYVEKHLIPRLNGFELLMASYAMAHLKLDLLLQETGYKPTKDQRLKVFLTNSLEQAPSEVPNLFMADWLSQEAVEADKVKRDTPVMCIIGNPPYSGISSNNGEWISELIEDYKYVNGVHFKERKHWLNDDYVKFIRYGQHYIEKNETGVLAFINPHGYLDNPTFRGMRWNLLKTYDKIFTIDLHGNSKKKETALDGSADINVFDIQQGVAINIFVKTNKKKPEEFAKVYHFDLYGKRNVKYDFLNNNSINNIDFDELSPQEPFYFFVKRNTESKKQYENGFSVSELFAEYALGMMTGKDDLLVGHSKDSLHSFINNIESFDFTKVKETAYFKWDWVVPYIVNNQERLRNTVRDVLYRPFDKRVVLYDNKLLQRDLFKIQKNYFQQNLGLIICRQGTASNLNEWESVTITNTMSDINMFRRGGGTNFPLYRVDIENWKGDEDSLTVNFNDEILSQIVKGFGFTYRGSDRKNGGKGTKGTTTFSAEDLFDYIYAVLHSPAYREKYKEFLKIDFPRVPIPKVETFFKLVELGAGLREIHLMESDKVEVFITTYPKDGNNEVGKPTYKDGAVWINEHQYFDGVPQVAWNFYIGGYQPAQKWLKDRKGRELEIEDIMHYQKIIVALTETDRLMKEIDKVGVV